MKVEVDVIVHESYHIFQRSRMTNSSIRIASEKKKNLKKEKYLKKQFSSLHARFDGQGSSAGCRQRVLESIDERHPSNLSSGFHIESERKVEPPSNISIFSVCAIRYQS